MLFRGNEVPEDFPHRDTLREIEALLEDPAKDFGVFEIIVTSSLSKFTCRTSSPARTTRWETPSWDGLGPRSSKFLFMLRSERHWLGIWQRKRRRWASFGNGLAIFDEAFSKMDGKTSVR